MHSAAYLPSIYPETVHQQPVAMAEHVKPKRPGSAFLLVSDPFLFEFPRCSRPLSPLLLVACPFFCGVCSTFLSVRWHFTLDRTGRFPICSVVTRGSLTRGMYIFPLASTSASKFFSFPSLLRLSAAR